MAGSTSRLLRGVIAAGFLLGSACAIGYGAALALDGQGEPAALHLVKGESGQEHRAALKQQVTVAKRPLSSEDAAWIRADAKAHPLTGTPLYLAGADRGLAGDTASGERLVDLAIARDPRLLPPRYWRVRNAMDQRRPAEATDAMLRVMVLDSASLTNAIPVLVELTRFPESWPRLRKALAADDASWHEPYFHALVGAGFDPAMVFSAIDVANKSGRRSPSVREQAALLGSMIGKNDYERAYTAWIGWLPPRALAHVAFLYDGNFNGAAGAPPFNWTFVSNEVGSAEIDRGRGMRFDLTPRDPIQLAAQIVLLPAGRYRLQTVATLDQPLREGEQMPLAWHIVCLPSRKPLAELPLANSADAKGVAGAFEVPADCPAQLLSFDASAMEFPVRMGGLVRSIALSEVK